MPVPLALAALVLVTVIWGTTFAVVKDALATIPVALLLALRFSLAALFFAWVRFDRRAVGPALALGLLAFAGFGTQTLGLERTGASRAAFITGLSVVLTPLVLAALLRRPVPPRIWAAIALAVAGLALLTLPGAGDAGPLNRGDLWVLLCALSYALYIVYLGEVAGRARGMALAGMQHLPMAALAWLWAAPQAGRLAEVPVPTLLAILYLALAATALVAVLQTYAQRVVPAYVAALIFVLEPVFAALFAYLLLGERLALQGWIGGGLVVLAMAVAEVRPRELRARLRARRASERPVGPADRP